MQFPSSEVVVWNYCSWEDKTMSTTGTFPPRLPETATKVWYQKLFDMIKEKRLWKCLFATNWFVFQILLERLCLHSFSSTTTNCFLRVCLCTLIAGVLKIFRPIKTSAISGTANSNKSALTRFLAGTTYLRKNGMAVPPITSAPTPGPRC